MANHKVQSSKRIRLLSIKKGKVGRDCFEWNPLEASESSRLWWFLIGWVVVFSFWLRLFAGQGEVLPPGEESSRLFPNKVCKWLTSGRQESSPNWLHSSILNGVSFIHFRIIQIMSLMLQFLAKDTNLVCRYIDFLSSTCLNSPFGAPLSVIWKCEVGTVTAHVFIY